MVRKRQLRTLESAGEFFHRFRNVFSAMSALRKIPEKKRISPQFSEKIMLAVCGVNECAYCSYLHTQTALEKGLSKDEVEMLLTGEWSNLSEDELPAILYAQHFSETKGDVSAKARESFEKSYDEAAARHIEGCLQSVFFGNLCCNTVCVREDPAEYPGRPPGLITYLLAKPVAAMIKRRQKTDDSGNALV